ncbi:MAG: hypothetical protein ACRBK7_31800 [Acidimicrobiales bacterium]
MIADRYSPKLEEFVGEDVANNIMSLLPYQPHEELATRADLAGLTSMLRSEMAELRADLRNEMGELRAELRGEMVTLSTDLRGDFASHSALVQRWGIGLVSANLMALIAALVGPVFL